MLCYPGQAFWHYITVLAVRQAPPLATANYLWYLVGLTKAGLSWHNLACCSTNILARVSNFYKSLPGNTPGPAPA